MDSGSLWVGTVAYKDAAVQCSGSFKVLTWIPGGGDAKRSLR